MQNFYAIMDIYMRRASEAKEVGRTTAVTKYVYRQSLKYHLITEKIDTVHQCFTAFMEAVFIIKSQGGRIIPADQHSDAVKAS